MGDKEHEEWLQDEKKRKQLHVSHTLAAKKKHASAMAKKLADAGVDEIQGAGNAADEQAARERSDGLQGGLAV
jgi:hypothetical protein